MCGIGVISVTMYSDRYDSFVPNVTDIFGSSEHSPAGADVRPVFGPMLGPRGGRWASTGPALDWFSVFAGWVSTLCWFSVGPCLRRCPGTAPTLGRSWYLLGSTILCNNVDFWLFRSAYMFFFRPGLFAPSRGPQGKKSVLDNP